MTEEEIERRVEKMIDHLDRIYSASEMSREDYDKAMRELGVWAERKKLEEQKKADEEAGAPLGWTGAQVRALRAVFERQPLTLKWDGKANMPSRAENYPPEEAPRMSYASFANLAHLSFGALMVPWCGMWLGIEPDGYTHS